MNFDPFSVLNEDIHRFILQHLDFIDVLRASLVSRLWYSTVGSSRECNNKLIFNISNEYQAAILRETLKKYERIKLTPNYLNTKRTSELTNILRRFTVKYMRINELYEKGIEQNDYFNIIESIAETVEYLILCDVNIKNAGRSFKKVDFLNLRKLHCTFTFTGAKVLSILLGSNPKLKHVVISVNLLHENDEQLGQDSVLIKFLKKNNKITKLCLLNLDQIFLNDISLILNTLHHFTFTTSLVVKSRKVRDNLLKFLKAQSQLEKIHIMGCKNNSILTDIWNNSRFVRVFTIDCNLQGDINTCFLQKNPFVEEINFYLTSSLVALLFLRVSPNVKYINVRQLSKPLLEYCINHMKCLIQITFQSVDSDAYTLYSKHVNNSSLKLKELDFFEYLNYQKN